MSRKDELRAMVDAQMAKDVAARDWTEIYAVATQQYETYLKEIVAGVYKLGYNDGALAMVTIARDIAASVKDGAQ